MLQRSSTFYHFKSPTDCTGATRTTSCIHAFFQTPHTLLASADAVLRRGPGVHSGPQLQLEQEVLRRGLSG